jgi:hypothetical protein
MGPLAYHALWVATALGVIALASALITRHLRWSDLRRAAAVEALEALARYSEWLALQRRNPGFQGDPAIDRSPLVQLRRAQQACFPELAAALVQLLEVHGRAMDFLWAQQLLRTRDLEAWLVSDHDARFEVLWREHRAAVNGMADRLLQLAGAGLLADRPGSAFPA